MARGRAAGCLGGFLILLLVAAGALWFFGPDLLRRGGAPVAVEVSPEAAEQAEAKLARLRAEGDTAYLNEVELASLVRYRAGGLNSELLQDPTIAMRGDTLHVGARVPSDRLPNLRELERIRAFLPDTTRLEMEGRLQPLVAGRSAIEVEQVYFAGIPIPERFYPDVLERLGRRDEPGLAPYAIAVPLPDGVGSARVEGGLLILTP
jgi:hypothetical protein